MKLTFNNLLGMQILSTLSFISTPSLTAQVNLPTDSTRSPDAEGAKVLQAHTSEFEASFLQVPRTCKVSHAAFDEIKVGVELQSPEVAAIHALV